ncbi:MAG: MlaD family protein [Puniceicoccales bacterium]|jgi:paraquat-inducible protein B|nr:MlaD family protein [Puniceicoccales bacterium]
MLKKNNTILIGVFVVVGVVLFVSAVVVFSSMDLLAKKMTFYSFFDTSLNGLDVGAPVKFKGVKVGTVESIEIIYDNELDEAATAVIFNINANLFKTFKGSRLRVSDYDMFYGEQIDRGLAAKLSMESILTGRLYVGLDYHKNKQERVFKDIHLKKYKNMPSVATDLDEFMASFDVIMKKLSKFDFEKISSKITSFLDVLEIKVRNLDFSSLNKAMESIADVLTFDSSTRRAIDVLVQQFSKTLCSLRVLLEFLERNPNAIVAGKAP